MAFLAPRRALRRRNWAWRYEPFVRTAAQADGRRDSHPRPRDGATTSGGARRASTVNCSTSASSSARPPCRLSSRWSGQVVGEERAPSLRGRLGRAAAIDFFVVPRASRLLRVSLISDLVVDKSLITGRATGYCCPVGRSHDGLRKPSDRATKLSLILPFPRYHQGRPHSISCSARSRWSRKLLK